MTITAAVVSDGALHPTLDAIAAGDHERSLIYRPDTPEIDSLVEHWQGLGRYIGAIAAANGAQIDFERQVAKFADDLARDLRSAELNGQSSAPSNKQLAATLKGLLDVIGDPEQIAGHRAAYQALHELFVSMPRAAILRRAVASEIGLLRMSRLAAAYKEWEAAR